MSSETIQLSYLVAVGVVWLYLQHKFIVAWAPGKQFILLVASILWPATLICVLLEQIAKGVNKRGY